FHGGSSFSVSVLSFYPARLELSLKKGESFSRSFQDKSGILEMKEGFGMRILFIEDDTALCAALAPALAGLGTAEFCHTGPEGLGLLASGGYDLCILDRMLPGLDGVTLLRAARAKGVRTPVLMLTA